MSGLLPVGPEEVADMFGTNRIARAVYASLTEEERQLEKLALTIPGFETREQMEKERLYR